MGPGTGLNRGLEESGLEAACAQLADGGRGSLKLWCRGLTLTAGWGRRRGGGVDGGLPTRIGLDACEPALAVVATQEVKEELAAVVIAGQRGAGVGREAALSGCMRKIAGSTLSISIIVLYPSFL